MRLRTRSGGDLWLAYGMNVHAGADADAFEAAIADTVLPLRRRLGVDGPFGLAPRFDAAGARALLADDVRRARLSQTLARHRLVPFTANAFVAGDFHREGAKESVYRPTWRERARADYTIAVAEVMASLVGPGVRTSISTSPLTFKRYGEGADAIEGGARALVETARRLRALEEATGTRVLLSIEPEPLCALETTEEALRFFEGPLADAIGREVALWRHLGLCFDVCHQAVQGEDAVRSLDRIRAAGVAVGKVQASCALVLPDPADEAGRRALARLDEPRWLHQVVTRAADGATLRAADLPEALTGPDAARWRGASEPWRVHFHVPVHREALLPPLVTTRPVLEAVLARVARGDVTEHLEIETYAFHALPEEARPDSLVESLARETEWVLSVLARHGVAPAEAETQAPSERAP